ncbi:MAG: hypothetical protein K5745_05165 [Saccharofermentans sp.]|nr:hypothetical protein [Saccharofermentans sp.]
MKTWKLIAGILTCVFFLLVSFQSCAAGLYNAMADNNDSSGSAGVMVAILMLAGGIVSIVTRKSPRDGGNIALIVLFGIAGLIGFTSYGTFKDLVVWSAWCWLNALLAVISIVLNSRPKKKRDNIPTGE